MGWWVVKDTLIRIQIACCFSDNRLKVQTIQRWTLMDKVWVQVAFNKPPSTLLLMLCTTATWTSPPTKKTIHFWTTLTTNISRGNSTSNDPAATASSHRRRQSLKHQQSTRASWVMAREHTPQPLHSSSPGPKPTSSGRIQCRLSYAARRWISRRSITTRER